MTDLSPEDEIIFKLMQYVWMHARCSMTDRENAVFRLRFGLEDGKGRTLEAIARQLGITRERVRQIEAKAVRKFRCHIEQTINAPSTKKEP